MKGYNAKRTTYQDANDHVVTALLMGEHDGGGRLPDGSHAALGFCVGSPLAETCQEYSRQGGYLFVYDITGEVPGRVNFRSIVGGPTRTGDALFPDPRYVQTAGNA